MLLPPVWVTTTSAIGGLGAPAGVVAVRKPSLITTTSVAGFPPMVTVVVEMKPLPEIVIGVPPVEVPRDGKMRMIRGPVGRTVI